VPTEVPGALELEYKLGELHPVVGSDDLGCLFANHVLFVRFGISVLAAGIEKYTAIASNCGQSILTAQGGKA
jgi:hypothetical protein